MVRRDKFILVEDNKPEETVLPAVKLEQEPVALSPEFTPELTSETKEEVPQEVKVNAFAGVISNLISSEWQAIESVNNAIATFALENPEDTSSVEILKQMVDEKTSHVGMLQKVLGNIDGTTSELVKAGEEKAEAIVEPKEEIKEYFVENLQKNIYWFDWVMNELQYHIEEFKRDANKNDAQVEPQSEFHKVIMELAKSKELTEEVAEWVSSSIESVDELWEHVSKVIIDLVAESLDEIIVGKNNPNMLTGTIDNTKK